MHIHIYIISGSPSHRWSASPVEPTVKQGHSEDTQHILYMNTYLWKNKYVYIYMHIHIYIISGSPSHRWSASPVEPTVKQGHSEDTQHILYMNTYI